MSKSLIIGAHMSISQGFDGAIHEAESIGATTMQIFTANQRQWHHKGLEEEAVKRYLKALPSSSITHVTSHNGYLINLGSPSEEVYTKSQEAFRQEIERCLALKVNYLVFHPGAALTSPRDVCLEKIAKSLLAMEPLLQGKEVTLLIETMAGQGSVVGSTFEEIAFLLEKTKKTLSIGVCVDTCHIFAAGYDIRTEKALKETLFQFDRIIGLDMIKALHLNDSHKDLGSKVDRHEPIGEGFIGLEGFKAIVRHPLLSKLPMYLETPGGPEVWKKEIALLNKLSI